MKEYIKTLLSGVLLGAVLMEMINAAVRSFIKKGFTLGGEILLPALVIMVGYTGWKLAESHFNGTRYKEIYHKGYTEGAKLHSYKIVIPIEEEE
nr:MAG TPA: hypothetical protein [Caudoviricetes sp.]